ncbi:cytochrome c biogenesis CcdA family protein [Microcoleus sp. FACHB-672]|uniref:cytochrome c biogenesis CcdA family protein n=1 Tax=Microcoleus sp. FACHB-672 TaxID=2692825 RepID=UPI001684A743|nr:cytochrome c biogenesis CcdA family protein [Microcoleus sp. FACHB-672]MBD2040354.1 cytochrome c biogenesis protein CcdA [Microcoleus sp. FACHB-672]
MNRTKWFTQNFPKSNHSKIIMLGLLFGGTVLLVLILSRLNLRFLSEPFENFVFGVAESYQGWFESQVTNNPFVLIPLAFAGGLIASISPCILSLLPVNLSYIGTREITSRWDAFIKAGSFVLGVVTILSLFGLFSSFAGAVMIYFRGYIQIAVGAIIVLMGLNLAGIVPLPLPQIDFKLPIAGPYGVGLTFALLSSPCTSPVMFAVLSAGGATGSQVLSTLMMISYSLGYTAIIFFASLFTGFVKQTRFLLNHSQTIIRFASVVLILIGGYYLFEGVRWGISAMT